MRRSARESLRLKSKWPSLVLACALALIMLACAGARAEVIASPTVIAPVGFNGEAEDLAPGPTDPRLMPPFAGNAQTDFTQAQGLLGNISDNAWNSQSPGADPAGDHGHPYALSPILPTAALEDIEPPSQQPVISDNIDPEVWVLMWGVAGLIILAGVYLNRAFRRTGGKRRRRRGRRRRLLVDGSHGFAQPDGYLHEPHEQAGQQAFFLALIPNGQAGFSGQWQYAHGSYGFPGQARGPGFPNHGPGLGPSAANGHDSPDEPLKIYAWYELESM